MSTEQWEQQEDTDIQLYFRQQQWFFGLIGILLESKLMHPINETAFQVALHQLNKSLKALNFSPASRMIHQARLMSRVIMLVGLMDSSCCREHGILSGSFEPVDILKLQDQMVMSLSHAWAGLQQVLIARLYVSELTAIMRAVLRIIVEQKYGTYATMFATPGETPNSIQSVDLNYVVLNIGQNNKAWDSFCAVVSQMLKTNKMNKDQVNGHIKHLFLDNESPWLTVQPNYELDLLLDTASTRHLDLDFLLPQDTPITLNAMQAEMRQHKLSSDVLTKSELVRTNECWVDSGASVNPMSPFSKFFPFFSKPIDSKSVGSAPKRSWVNDLVHGVVKISTHALLYFCQLDYQRTFERKLSAKSLRLQCVTNSHIAVVPSDLAGIHNHLPYLADVQRMQSGNASAEIVNQRYVNSRIHSVLNPKRKRQKVQTMPRFTIPADVPLGLTCAQQHIENLVKSRPENPPSVHRLFVADPEGLNVRFAPYVLQILLRGNHLHNADRAAQRTQIVELLMSQFEDFLWPLDTDGTPWKKDPTRRDQFANYIADLVVELYHCNGVGKLAQTAANDIDAHSDDKEYANMHNKRVAQAIERRTTGVEHAFEHHADSQHRFVSEWSQLHQNNPTHVGAHYVDQIRSTAHQMIDTWKTTDYWWTSKLPDNQHIRQPAV